MSIDVLTSQAISKDENEITSPGGQYSGSFVAPLNTVADLAGPGAPDSSAGFQNPGRHGTQHRGQHYATKILNRTIKPVKKIGVVRVW